MAKVATIASVGGAAFLAGTLSVVFVPSSNGDADDAARLRDLAVGLGIAAGALVDELASGPSSGAYSGQLFVWTTSTSSSRSAGYEHPVAAGWKSRPTKARRPADAGSRHVVCCVHPVVAGRRSPAPENRALVPVAWYQKRSCGPPMPGAASGTVTICVIEDRSQVALPNRAA
jgi:hypothetical protein